MGGPGTIGNIMQELRPEAVTAFLGVTIFSLLVTVALGYLAVQSDRIRGLRTITAAYAFHSLRFLAFACVPLIGKAHALFATNLFNTLAGVFMIAGALRMAGVRVPVRTLAALGAAGIAVAAWGSYGDFPSAARAVLMTMLGGVAQFFFAWALYRLAKNTIFRGYLVVSAFAAAYGLLRLSAPYLAPSGEAQVTGLLVASSLYLATAIALIIALQRSQYLEAREARDRAERAGQLSQAAIDSTTDLMGLLRVAPDGRLIIERVNPAFIAFTRAAYPHHKVESFVDRDMVDVMRNEYRLPLADADALLAIYREAIRSKVPQHSVARHGNRIREAVITPLLDGGGTVTHVFYRGTDLTERRQADEERRRSGAQFRAILDQAPVSVSITSLAEGYIRYVNPAWTQQTGYSQDEAIGRTVLALGIWNERPGGRERVRAALEDLGVLQTELAYRTKSGRRVEIVVSLQRIDYQGEPSILSISIDVTEVNESRRRAGQLTERLATFFKVSPVPLVVTENATGRFLEVNEAWLQLEGRRREEVIGRTAMELDIWVDPADRERMAAQVRHDGRLRNFFTRFRRGTGQVVDCVVSVEPIEWDGVAANLVSSHDVSEIETARREAQAARVQLEAILEHSPVSISITRFTDGSLLYVNPAWSRQTGYAREETLGRTTTEVGVWADAQARDERMLNKLAAGETAHFTRAFRNKLGRDMHVLVAALAIEYKGERCVLAISQDITESEENRRRAGEATERLARVFNLSPAPMVVTTLDGGAILEVNDAWLAFYRGKREHVIGRSTLQLDHWADEGDRKRLVDALRERRRVSGFYCRFRRRDGSIADCILNAETIDWGGAEAILGSLQDVTEMRRVNETLERRVRERTAELEQTLGELEAFSYSVSHDLRAPLRAMSSFATLLAARPAVAADAQAASHALRITRAAGRMAQIVNELLHYSRLARQPIEAQPFALGDEVRALAREMGEQAPGRRIRWDIGALPGLRGDPTLLRLVLQNLLDNAVKYSRPREQAVITVRAKEEKGVVEVSVCDNGVGFDMAHAANLFRPFQRLHDDRDFEGTGIGLAHAKRILERHGGRIWAEAAPGKGATFRFTLPR